MRAGRQAMTDEHRDSSGTTPTASAGAQRAAIIDWTGLESRYADRAPFVRRLVEIAISTMCDVPAQLRKFADAGRTTEIAALAHSLRTGAHVLMAYRVRDLAAAVEDACRGGVVTAVPLARSLADVLDQLLVALGGRLDRASDEQHGPSRDRGA